MLLNYTRIGSDSVYTCQEWHGAVVETSTTLCRYQKYDQSILATACVHTEILIIDNTISHKFDR